MAQKQGGQDTLIRLQPGHVLDRFRHQDRALPRIETAIRLGPRDPLLQNMPSYNAQILHHLNRYQDALAAADAMGAMVSACPWEIRYHLMRAAIRAELDRVGDAQAPIGVATAFNPHLGPNSTKARFDKRRNHPENRSIRLASPRRAGLPE